MIYLKKIINTKFFDPVLTICMTLLVLCGILGIYSAKYHTADKLLYQKQIIWFLLSLFVLFIFQYFSPKLLYDFAYLGYFFLLFMLGAVFLIGVSRMGARRWIGFGSYQIQPSEIGKLVLVIVLARYYCAASHNWKDFKLLIQGGILTLIPFLMVFKEPDLGTSLVYLVIYISILFATGMPLFYLINFVSIPLLIIANGLGIQVFVTLLIIYGIILFKYRINYLIAFSLWLFNLISGISASILWNKLKPYQRMRILTFLDPEKYIRDGGWQVVQSKAAIANGGFSGEGFLAGSQTQLKFLPEGHTDFIFSVIAEEFGTIGVIVILVLFTVLIYRCIAISLMVKNRFYYLTALGITTIFIYQIFINIGMTIGITPVTGLPLPFLSYGGSSLLFNVSMIGVLLSIKYHKRDF